MDLYVGQSGVVVHRGVDVVVAAAPEGSGLGTSAVDAPAASVGGPPELLDVDVHQLSRTFAFLPPDDPAGGAVPPARARQVGGAANTRATGPGRKPLSSSRTDTHN